jgi:uncharacterized protein YjiS (DUF1127 family)
MAHVIHFRDYALPARLSGFFARFSAALADYRAYVATYDELAALSDRELDDLGVSRHNIRDVARESVYGN